MSLSATSPLHEVVTACPAAELPARAAMGLAGSVYSAARDKVVPSFLQNHVVRVEQVAEDISRPLHGTVDQMIHSIDKRLHKVVNQVPGSVTAAKIFESTRQRLSSSCSEEQLKLDTNTSPTRQRPQ